MDLDEKIYDYRWLVTTSEYNLMWILDLMSLKVMQGCQV